MRRTAYSSGVSRTVIVAGTALAIVGGGLTASAPAVIRSGTTQRLEPGGAWPSMSADGRFISYAKEDGPNGEITNIYVQDVETGALERISEGHGGEPADDSSSAEQRISRDGRFVVFSSRASNLVPGDTNGGADAFLHDRATGTTQRISVGPEGEQLDAENQSYRAPAVSGDGRFVAFVTTAALLPEDENVFDDIYVRDRVTGVLELVAGRGWDGAPASSGALQPAFSADGRFVAFTSEATNLVPGDDGPKSDVFVHDRQTGTTEAVSVSDRGESGNERSNYPSISADGRFVAFQSMASNLVPGDNMQCVWPSNTPGAPGPRISCADVFVRDRMLGTTERISISSHGAEGEADAGFPAISGDGRYVAFESGGSGLSPDRPLPYAMTDVYIHDRVAGSTERISLSADGEGADSGSHAPAISSDGRLVAFTSGAGNLTPDSVQFTLGLYVRDRGPAIMIRDPEVFPQEDAFLVRARARLEPAIITQGKDPASDGLPGADQVGGELGGASVALRPEWNDLYLRIDASTIPRARPGRTVGRLQCQDHPHVVCGEPIQGQTVAPGVVWGMSFVLDETEWQIRAAREKEQSFGLFRCASVCEHHADLEGGVGTLGEAVVASVPVDDLGLGVGDRLEQVRTFSALGRFDAAALEVIDSMTLPPATLPESGVRLGIAPVGTPEDEVAFDTPVAFGDGRIWGRIDVPGPGSYDVWARACVRRDCRTVMTTASSEAIGADGVWVSQDAGSLRVSGTAEFTDQPVVVSDQPGTGTGIDVTTATIERQVGSSALSFTYNLDAPTTDLPPVVYRWPVAVDGIDRDLYLEAGRVGPDSTEPTFALIGYADDASGEAVRAWLTGELTSDYVRWHVPMSLIYAHGGSTVVQGGGAYAEVRTGLAGSASACCPTHVTFDTVTLDAYEVPSATVEVGVAPAGTPPEQVKLEEAEVGVAAGQFHVVLPRPPESGHHVVVVRSCYGPSSCATRVVDVEL